MLIKFEVTNFKNFKSKFTFDLQSVATYDYNEETMNGNIVKDAIIFGKNGTGKSNLSQALFDINIHLTDNTRDLQSYKNYLNLDSKRTEATFTYYFQFGSTNVVYNYRKKDSETLNFEKLIINGNTVVEYNYQNKVGKVRLEGAETLKLERLENKLSILKYIHRNSILKETPENQSFLLFFDFVDKMLLFTSVMGNKYQGFKVGIDSIAEIIVKQEKVHHFQMFLKDHGIDAKLSGRKWDDEYYIIQKHMQGESNFFETASTGTKSLALIYFWVLQLNEASFVFIDEFDAFYHFELAETIVKELIKHQCQIIFTTHNNNLITNSFLRPDCLYILDKKKNLKPISMRTEKNLKKVHNLQKMYKAGTFNE
ncbi:MAG: AAA family ATPase [Culicoidibacterales bacterium]